MFSFSFVSSALRADTQRRLSFLVFLAPHRRRVGETRRRSPSRTGFPVSRGRVGTAGSPCVPVRPLVFGADSLGLCWQWHPTEFHASAKRSVLEVLNELPRLIRFTLQKRMGYEESEISMQC
ncbi:hypothetical protein AOLI_G00151630 [Acnodon oligacanthus]